MATIEAKANQAKRDAIVILEEKFEKAQGIVFTDFRGLSVAQMNELRGKFFEAGGTEFLVAKNTLTKIALKNKGTEITNDDLLIGPTGMGIGYEDAVTPAKVLSAFAKGNDKLVFKGAIVDGEYYDVDQVKQLASLPPVDQLRAMVVGGIASPLTGFVGVLNETVRSFVAILDAIIEKKKAEEAA